MTKISRRAFSVSLVGAGVGFSTRRASAEAGGLRPSIVNGVLVGVQSYTFRKFDLERMIAAMRSIGISSLELWEGHLDPRKDGDDDCRTARRKLDAAGISVGAYCVNFQPEDGDDVLQRSVRWAGLLGAKVMTTSIKKVLVPRVDALCREHRVYIGLHNHWYGADFEGDRAQEFIHPEDFLKALDGASPYLSINLDIGHFFAAGHDPVSFLREHHERIVSLHVKDRDKDPTHGYRRFGEGATPIREVAKVLREIGFRYAANLEYEIEENDPTAGVRHAFDYFKRALEA